MITISFDTLSRYAHSNAVIQGHEMGAFMASKYDIYVSVCRVCRAQMYINRHAKGTESSLYGHALEQQCKEVWPITIL